MRDGWKQKRLAANAEVKSLKASRKAAELEELVQETLKPDLEKLWELIRECEDNLASVKRLERKEISLALKDTATEKAAMESAAEAVPSVGLNVERETAGLQATTMAEKGKEVTAKGKAR
eukprot:6190864-Pleurochrysis_carterae.AAC.1